MTHAYQAIISYKGDSWEGFLEEIGVDDVFSPLLKEYTEPHVFKSAITYILMAYSPDSPAIIMGAEWHKNKQSILEQAQVEPIVGMYEALVLLKNEAVLKTINNWLEFQQQDTFKQLQILKDLRVEMQMASLSDIKKATLEIDYDAKFKCAGYAGELKKMIQDLESELFQSDPKMKDGVKEVRKASSSQVFAGPEKFAK
jgi:hypothetical protein